MPSSKVNKQMASSKTISQTNVPAKKAKAKADQPPKSTVRVSVEAVVSVPTDRRRVVSTPGSYTSAFLLSDAAAKLLNEMRKDGSHMSIEDAIMKTATALGAPRSTVRRANAAFNLLFTSPATRRRLEFGKGYSDSGNDFAKKAVRQNGETRALALRKAAERAEYILTQEDWKQAGRTLTTPMTDQHIAKKDSAIAG
jgi:hypothetical protein